MMAAPLVVYFLVLLGAIVIAGSTLALFEAVLVVAVLAMIGGALTRAWWRMMADDEASEEESFAEAAAEVAYAMEHGGSPRLGTSGEIHVPQPVLSYLLDHRVRFDWAPHAPAATAAELAVALQLRADRVAKPVMVRADGTVWMAVVPANERVDVAALREALHVDSVELMSEEELGWLFPDCEVGAEPPLGRLFHIPTIVEEDLAHGHTIAFHGGRHDESLQLAARDYLRLERPLIAHFGRPQQLARA